MTLNCLRVVQGFERATCPLEISGTVVFVVAVGLRAAGRRDVGMRTGSPRQGSASATHPRSQASRAPASWTVQSARIPFTGQPRTRRLNPSWIMTPLHYPLLRVWRANRYRCHTYPDFVAFRRLNVCLIPVSYTLASSHPHRKTPPQRLQPFAPVPHLTKVNYTVGGRLLEITRY